VRNGEEKRLEDHQAIAKVVLRGRLGAQQKRLATVGEAVPALRLDLLAKSKICAVQAVVQIVDKENVGLLRIGQGVKFVIVVRVRVEKR